MKSVFLSAGHSTTDPGAVGKMKDAAGKVVELKEADVAAEIRNIVSYYLTQMFITHEVDGKGTANIPLREAIVKARKHPIGVEFHLNAAASAQANGVETLSAPKDMKLGADLCVAIQKVMGTKNRGAKPENAGQHHRLAFVQAGGLILELFFVSNPGEVATYQAKKWLLGKAIAEVLAKHAKA